MLDLYYAKLSKQTPYTFVISCDVDDATMNNETVIKKLQQYPHLHYYFGNSATKVASYNADMDKHQDWDIVLVVSDDMEPVVQNYDLIIAQKMTQYFPDYDGILSFHDGYVGSQVNTYPIIGKKYYDRFNYIYAPCYQSLWCDNELTVISKILKKEKICKECIIRRNNATKNNEDVEISSDSTTYIQRRESNFYIDQKDIDNATPKMWSILICTLDEREKSFNFIYNKLQKQIADLGLQDQIEIVYFKDNRENSVGFKRNWLLEQSSGKYTCYVDDDDDISDDYIQIIYEKLLKNPDCVEMQGVMTFSGKKPHLFIHSIKYNNSYTSEGNFLPAQDNVYYRPPNHLNPIKRVYGCQFSFPEVNFAEDADWATQIAKTGLLKKEEQIDKPCYFYKYTTKRNYKKLFILYLFLSVFVVLLIKKDAFHHFKKSYKN
jgi:hypothetical protein